VKFEVIDYIGAAWVCIVLVVLVAYLIKLTEPYYGKPSDPQRYTVHFDGIDYQDLERDFHGLSRSRSEYKTKAGKRIEFHGNFYEVEQ
jgi:hypothetical protein